MKLKEKFINIKDRIKWSFKKVPKMSSDLKVQDELIYFFNTHPEFINNRSKFFLLFKNRNSRYFPDVGISTVVDDSWFIPIIFDTVRFESKKLFKFLLSHPETDLSALNPNNDNINLLENCFFWKKLDYALLLKDKNYNILSYNENRPKFRENTNSLYYFFHYNYISQSSKDRKSLEFLTLYLKNNFIKDFDFNTARYKRRPYLLNKVLNYNYDYVYELLYNDYIYGEDLDFLLSSLNLDSLNNLYTKIKKENKSSHSNDKIKKLRRYINERNFKNELQS